MIALIETETIPYSPPRRLYFPPEHTKYYLNDEGTGIDLVYIGYVTCPTCHHSWEVGAAADETLRAYCPVERCYLKHGTRITVSIDPAYLRPDDSLTGCICGDEDCEYWSELDAVEEAV